MSRAAGKHGPRQVLEDLIDATGLVDTGGPTEGQLREEGVGEPREIPGGKNHLANPPLTHPPVPVPEQEWPYRRAVLAHGVPPDEAGRNYRDPRLTGGQRGKPARTEQPAPRATPVPVYIVEGEAGPGVVRSAFPRSVQCPASTSAEPVRVCGRNENRVEVLILNEDTATDIRFAANLSALAAGTGALLPWPSNSYVRLRTQDELYAIGATGTGTPRLSVIEVFEEQDR